MVEYLLPQNTAQHAFWLKSHATLEIYNGTGPWFMILLGRQMMYRDLLLIRIQTQMKTYVMRISNIELTVEADG